MEPVKLASAFDVHASGMQHGLPGADAGSAIVVFPYEAREDDELSIGKGEKLYIINKFPDEWYLVQNAQVATRARARGITVSQAYARLCRPWISETPPSLDHGRPCFFDLMSCPRADVCGVCGRERSVSFPPTISRSVRRHHRRQQAQTPLPCPTPARTGAMQD